MLSRLPQELFSFLPCLELFFHESMSKKLLIEVNFRKNNIFFGGNGNQMQGFAGNLPLELGPRRYIPP
jgi:hypothetical protein